MTGSSEQSNGRADSQGNPGERRWLIEKLDKNTTGTAALTKSWILQLSGNESTLKKARKGLSLEISKNNVRAASAVSGSRVLVVDTQTRGDAAATASIASVSDQDWYISRTHGVYHIPACGKNQTYALLMITPRGDAIDLGDNRRFPFTISAREIADDLLQDLLDHGIFVCAGPRPTSEELATATERRTRHYQTLIAEGDMMWARGHSFREISDLHRRAAISLGVEREWAYVPMRTSDCPACGEKVKAGVAVCKHCGAILDPDKAALHGLTRAIAPTGEAREARPAREVAIPNNRPGPTGPNQTPRAQ